jgi:hypothetical protein
MEQTYKLQLATRVLAALAEHTPPNGDDATALRALAESDPERNFSLDELACEIINREVRRRREGMMQARSGKGKD